MADWASGLKVEMSLAPGMSLPSRMTLQTGARSGCWAQPLPSVPQVAMVSR